MVNLINELKDCASSDKAKVLQSFFKTNPGEYGYGDVFWGITVPQNRVIAKKHRNLSERDLIKLIKHNVHEVRLCSLLILINKFKEDPDRIYKFYLKSRKYINNWDLVDVSAYKIVGTYLENKSKDILYDLAKSTVMWDRRIAIVSTFHFIKLGQSKETFKIADMLMQDKEDLMHKAVGWMLREVGKRCSDKELKDFLETRYKKMPRTMLRYAIERFPDSLRKQYLLGKV